MLAASGVLPNTLVCERKHKGVKVYANAMDNLHSGALLREVVNQQLYDLEHAEHLELSARLLPPFKSLPSEVKDWLQTSLDTTDACVCATNMRVNEWTVIGQGDFIAWTDPCCARG